MIPSLSLVYLYLLSVHFSFYLSSLVFKSISPPLTDIHFALFAWMSVLTRNHLSCLALPHFITCLTDLSVIARSPLPQTCIGEERSVKPAEDLL